MERTKKTGNGWLGVWITAGIILTLLLIYLGIALYYSTHFLPGTVINGVAVDGDGVEDVECKIIQEIEKYKIKLEAREGKEEVLAGIDIGVMPIFDGSLEEELNKQNCLGWPVSFFQTVEIEVETMVDYSESRLKQKVNELSIMDESKMRKPQNARISEYTKEEMFTIIPEEGGTRIREKKLLKVLGEAIVRLQTIVSLEEEGCYTKPKVTAKSKKLKKLVENLNHYAQVKVTYQFGEDEEVLDGEEISKWISVNDNQEVEVSGEEIAAYVNRLADKYDTVGKEKKFKTSYGKKVKVPGGDYGWKIDREKETEALTKLIQEGQVAEREPEYEKTANNPGKKDYGDTYVEVNLTAQHLIYYKNGEVVVDSDFVSGNEAKGWSTPTGAYGLYYKERNRTLRGQGYASPVSFWMPFNGGVGFHDAKWRGSFGGDYYKRRGSHGCINLPYSAAKTLYDNIEEGCAILVYKLPGTEGVSPKI